MADFSTFIQTGLRKKKWFITGGAGFIGSHAVDLLVSAGAEVTVFDDLSLSTIDNIKPHIDSGKITFIQKDLTDFEAVKSALAGHDIVWHLGANTDIPSGFTKHRIDLDNDVIATWNVLESMHQLGIKELLFASTGAVYGDDIVGDFREDSGPLKPLSLYGAGKLACEGFISAYCNLFGLKAWVFRFGNVIGERVNHGIIYDFVGKITKDKTSLEILGTGKGEKNYFLVEECIEGMLYVYNTIKDNRFPFVINLGNDSRSTVLGIAKIIAEEMEAPTITHTFTNTPLGWPGDQPVVLLDTNKVNQLGWHSKNSSDTSVRRATKRLLGKEDFQLTVDSLLTKEKN